MPHREIYGPEDRERIRQRQQKEVEGDAETYVMTRTVDHSIWARSAAIVDRYKVLIYLVVGIMLALGFGFKTPSQYYNELKTQVDDLTKRSSLADGKAQEIDHKLDQLLKFSCLKEDPRDLRLAGIDCPPIPLRPR